MRYFAAHQHTYATSHIDVEFVYRNRDRMFALALHLLDDREEAAEALQDACLAAFLGRGKARAERPSTIWLTVLVVDACRNHLRRRDRRSVPVGDFTDCEPITRDPSDAVDAALDVRAALRGLPLEQRTAIVLVDLLGYSYDDAAEELEVSAVTVKGRVARGRASLRKALRDHSPSSPRPPDLARFRAGLRRLRTDPVERDRITSIAADAVSDELPRLPDEGQRR